MNKLKKHRSEIVWGLVVIFLVLCATCFKNKQIVFRSPVLIETISPASDNWAEVKMNEMIQEALEEKCPVSEPEATRGDKWVGIASYYSEEGCIGCPPHFDENGKLFYRTANGEVFNDENKTIAFNELPLGTIVRVRNLENNMIVKVPVTDRHGADNEKYGWRIADLSLGTKKAINCSDLCEVEILEL